MILKYLIKLKSGVYSARLFAILVTLMQMKLAFAESLNLTRGLTSLDDNDPSSAPKSKCGDFNISATDIVWDNETLACRKELLESMLGPQRKSFTFIVCMSTVYILILVCGIIGNVSTCYVIVSNSCMHTTTNYYLFSLAVSDVLSLLSGLPTELYSIMVEAYPWAFGETFCVIRTFIFEITTIASVLTILTFTFERWLHICKPM